VFTGLVEARVAVLAWEPVGTGARLTLPAPALSPSAPPWTPVAGESLAVSGCCLTVVAIDSQGSVAFDLSRESLGRTWFGSLAVGRLVNLERSVRLTDRLGGHLVSGHVDGVGQVLAIEDAGDGGRRFTFRVPNGFERYLLQKGSVAVDGVSLTVVDPRGRDFDVAAIPETLARTTLGTARPGDAVHLEADMIGKWVERLYGVSHFPPPSLLREGGTTTTKAKVEESD